MKFVITSVVYFFVFHIVLLFQSMVQLFQPACSDLMETMSHELMSLSVSDCKISHYMSIIEAFCDTVTIAQSMDTVN